MSAAGPAEPAGAAAVAADLGAGALERAGAQARPERAEHVVREAEAQRRA